MKKAQELCDKQGGSVANVVTSTLRKYADVENDATLSRTRKYWPFKRIGRSNCPGAPYDGAEAAEYAQRAKDVNSKCAVAYLLSGDVALKLNDVNKASSDYNQAIYPG